MPGLKGFAEKETYRKQGPKGERSSGIAERGTGIQHRDERDDPGSPLPVPNGEGRGGSRK